MTQSRPYQVDNATLRSRWTNYIRPLVFAGVDPSPAPTALFIGAQPGAGKTQTSARVAAQYGRPFVSIDSDELRKSSTRTSSSRCWTGCIRTRKAITSVSAEGRESFERRMDRITADIASPDHLARMNVAGLQHDQDDESQHEQAHRGPRLGY